MMTTTDSFAAIRDKGHNEGKLAIAEFSYDVDGTTYYSKWRKITGAEIMATAKIPLSDGLIRLFPDGTTASIAPDEEVDLEPEARFKRRPRFKRG